MDESYYPGPNADPTLAEIMEQYKRGFVSVGRSLGRSSALVAETMAQFGRLSASTSTDISWHFDGNNINLRGVYPVYQGSDLRIASIDEFDGRDLTPRERALLARQTRNTGPADKFGLDGRKRRR